MIIDGVRRLVTVRTVRELTPIPGADKIELAVVDGWEAVVKKGEFTVGDFCLYFEIDSLIPVSDERFNFLSTTGTKRLYNNIEYYRIKSIKLRKQLSQGLALPISNFNEVDISDIKEYYDDVLSIEKYEVDVYNKTEKCIPANAAGVFPWFLHKTDEPRIQDLYYKISQYPDIEYAASLKLDGSSETVAFVSTDAYKNSTLNEDESYEFDYEDGQLLVASRNLTLKYNKDAGFWRALEIDNIPNKLRYYCNMHKVEIAIQGECMGIGIQNNRENIDGYKFYAFRIFIINEQRYATHDEFINICKELEIETAPQLGIVKVFDKYKTIKELLAASEIRSINNDIAEGIVYVSTKLVNGQRIHFKAINNQFLLNEK